ncbi:ComEC/Rec2 family competence protein [Candidatus Palauibacter irciniicola]|uniref:ComEC/Rec2 family competence protein n=1 Tax=Candidatus Palauibacter irciniicola TaxID=3056733 RepID=UPI003B017A70
MAAAPRAPTVDPDSVLRITFLDVGQADAVLIQAPGGRTALVDAGRDNIVPLLRRFGVSEIDLLVATHPHADHIGGMAGVIAAFPVRFYMDNGEPHTTQTYRRLLAALDARPEITYLEASPRTLTLGEVEIDVLPLLPRGTADHNDRSVTLLVRFGEFRAFLSGDSEVRQLTHLMNQGAVREVALLKAPHHGSDNGFTREFLNAARPRVVVISVGRNSYGHPRPAALRAYEASGATVFRTDWHGHVSVQGRESGDYDVSFGREVGAVVVVFDD